MYIPILAKEAKMSQKRTKMEEKGHKKTLLRCLTTRSSARYECDRFFKANVTNMYVGGGNRNEATIVTNE